MKATDQEVLQFAMENDVKFNRLAFCDLYGKLRNISVMTDELKRAFAYGVSFDASLVDGFADADGSDMVLHPDASTLEVLPWRPQTGRVARFYCDITYADGRPFEQDGREILRQAVRVAAEKGYDCKIGVKSEFYLFRLDENGDPTSIPHDKAGFLDVAPLDKGENVRRDICLTLEQMGIRPVSSHHEMGPGQNEISISPADPMTAAGNCITFRNLVRTIAVRNGLWASFDPKPLPDWDGSGFHINLSLTRNGRNLFLQDENGLNAEGAAFVAGILHYVPEMSVFLNSVPSSYARLGNHDAPKAVGWSQKTRSQLLRLPKPEGDTARMELRSPDGACNPYLVYSLMLRAGLQGIEQGLALPAADTRTGVELPDSLQDAIALAQGSSFLKEALPTETLAAFLKKKRAELSLK